jgi:hypothetical protein
MVTGRSARKDTNILDVYCLAALNNKSVFTNEEITARELQLARINISATRKRRTK